MVAVQVMNRSRSVRSVAKVAGNVDPVKALFSVISRMRR